MGCSGSKPPPPAKKPPPKAKPPKVSTPSTSYAVHEVVHSENEFAKLAEAACKAEVYMFSGCRDEQTSGDVSNVVSFGVPGPGGAGGAMTNSLLRQVYQPGETTWAVVLTEMVKYLEEKGYWQRPMLSTARRTNLCDTFSIAGDLTGDKHALLIGINYASHEKGKLAGSANDVASMKKYLEKQGWSEGGMEIMTDVEHEDLPVKTHPSRAEIEAAIERLVEKVKPGDVCVFHFSGHGSQVKDMNGDEEDGFDETLVPEDYKTAGQITDDYLFEMLCAKLPAGSRLFAVMDCCHSGTILDLPYAFEATPENLAVVSRSGEGYTAPNETFARLTETLKHTGVRLGNAKHKLGAATRKVFNRGV